MKVKDLLEAEGMDWQQFVELVRATCAQYKVQFAESALDDDAAEMYTEDHPHYKGLYTIGIYCEVNSLDLGDLVDKNAPGAEEIFNRLAKNPKPPRWKVIGQCADAILRALKDKGLRSLRVPTHEIDRRTGDVNDSVRWYHGDQVNSFSFVAWMKACADRGEEEISDMFSFNFSSNINLDYV